MEATEIILPDWFQNSQRTIDAAEVTADELSRVRYPGRIMFSPQGHDVSEWIACLQSILYLEIGVTTVGISMRYNEMFGNRRDMIAAVILGMDPSLAVHLLGWGNSGTDALHLPYVQGIDSSRPSLLAKFGRKFADEARPESKIDILSDVYDARLLAKNISSWKTLCCA